MLNRVAVAAAFLLLSVGAHSETIEHQPWIRVINDPNLIVDWPTLDLGASIPINNICDTGDKFETKVDVAICTQYSAYLRVACHDSEGESCHVVSADYQVRPGEIIREQDKCVQTEVKHLEISKVKNVLVCDGQMVYPIDEKSTPPYCNGQWVWKPQLMSGSYQVPILSKLIESSEQGYRVLAYKPYVIQCK